MLKLINELRKIAEYNINIKKLIEHTLTINNLKKIGFRRIFKKALKFNKINGNICIVKAIKHNLEKSM